MSYFSHARSKEEEENLRAVHQRQLEQDFPASPSCPPLFESTHRPSAAGYTPVNPPYVPVNPSPSYLSHSSHNPSTGYLPPASHNVLTANYLQSASHNPSVASYMSAPANYMQPSSPAGYIPPTPAQWFPNVVEQQGSFRYVKTARPPQRPRPSNRGGSPGFLYPPAARTHGLPPKPVAASSSSAKAPALKKKTTPAQATIVPTTSARVTSNNKVLRKVGGEAIIRAFVHVMGRGYIYMSKELIARLYKQQFISDKLNGPVLDWNILDCKILRDLVEVTPIQGVKYYRLNESFFNTLEPAGFTLSTFPAPPSTPFTSEQLATLPAVQPFSDQVIRALCSKFSSKVDNIGSRFPTLIPSRTGGVLDDMATFIELWHPSLGPETGPVTPVSSNGKEIVSRFDMTDEKFDELLAESLQRGSSGKHANKILKNFSSSMLRPLEEQRQALLSGSSTSESLASSSNPGPSNASRSVHMGTEPEDISSESSESSDESKSISSEFSQSASVTQSTTSTNVSKAPTQPASSVTRWTLAEIEARQIAKKAANKAKKTKKKANKKAKMSMIQSEAELDVTVRQAKEAFQAWASTQEPFVPKPRTPAKFAAPPSSSSSTKNSIIQEAVVQESIAGSSTIDIPMNPIPECAGTLDDKYLKNDFIESAGLPSGGGSSGPSSRDKPLEITNRSNSAVTNRDKSARFSPYANADRGLTRKPRLIMPASFTRQQGKVDSNMASTSTNGDDEELAALAQLPMDRMNRDQLIKARKASLEKILNYLWNLSRRCEKVHLYLQ